VDDQLRRRSVGAAAARSLLLTILGEFVLPRGEPVWQESLVEALMELGYSGHAARQALARSTRDGWLTAERHGRRARMTLTDDAKELLATGAQRIYSFGDPWTWDGRWLVLILRVPEERRDVRHQLRTQLAWAGFGSLGGGVWVTPHVEREAEAAALIDAESAADATSFIASIGDLGNPASVARAGWDLASVNAHYRDFIEDFARARASGPSACFRMQTLLVHAWRKFPFLDPDLPVELLPSDWLRVKAHELFVERHSRWQDVARARFKELELSRTARAA
jgi:phenylacetic acid degradation operon negative regulatory protein